MYGANFRPDITADASEARLTSSPRSGIPATAIEASRQAGDSIISSHKRPVLLFGQNINPEADSAGNVEESQATEENVDRAQSSSTHDLITSEKRGLKWRIYNNRTGMHTYLQTHQQVGALDFIQKKPGKTLTEIGTKAKYAGLSYQNIERINTSLATIGCEIVRHHLPKMGRASTFSLEELNPLPTSEEDRIPATASQAPWQQQF